jgi:hypothetical protein
MVHWRARGVAMVACSRLMRRAHHSATRGALVQWLHATAEKQRVRRVHARERLGLSPQAKLHGRRRTLGLAFEEWQHVHGQGQALVHIGFRALRALINGKRARAWRTWEQHVRRRRDEAAVLALIGRAYLLRRARAALLALRRQMVHSFLACRFAAAKVCAVFVVWRGQVVQAALKQRGAAAFVEGRVRRALNTWQASAERVGAGVTIRRCRALLAASGLKERARTLLTGFRRWVSHDEAESALRKASAWMTKHELHRAFVAWRWARLDLALQSARARAAAHRFGQSTLARGWNTWQAVAFSVAIVHMKVRKLLRNVLHQHSWRAFHSLVTHAEHRRQLRLGACALQRHAPRRAMVTWRDHAEARLVQSALLHRALAWMVVGPSVRRSWRLWTQRAVLDAAELDATQAAMERVIRRLRHRRLGRALNTWEALAVLLLKTARACSVWVHRRVATGFHSWLEAWLQQQGTLATTRAVLRQWRSRRLARGFDTWLGSVLEQVAHQATLATTIRVEIAR